MLCVSFLGYHNDYITLIKWQVSANSRLDIIADLINGMDANTVVYWVAFLASVATG